MPMFRNVKNAIMQTAKNLTNMDHLGETRDQEGYLSILSKILIETDK